MVPKSPPKTRVVDHQYFVRAPAASVFRAISEPTELIRWLCDRAELEARVGGSYLLAWEGGPAHTGKVVEFVAGQRIALGWRWPNVTLTGTVFALSVEPAPSGSLLHVQHTGFPVDEAWSELLAGAEWGWTYFAMNLKSFLETGHDLRSPQDG